MLANLLSLYGKFNYPFFNTLFIANHITPLSIAERVRQPYWPICGGPIKTQWDQFASTIPGGTAVSLVNGYALEGAAALGTLLFENSPKVIRIDVGLEYLDSEAALWFCKHELSHLKNSDILKQYVPLLISSLAASFFCKSWYSPLIIGLATHLIAEKTLGMRAEKSADDFAITHGTEEELKGAVRFFEAMIQLENEHCPPNSFSNRATRFVSVLFERHPSHRDRQADVEKELASQFGYDRARLDAIRNDDRIRKMKEYTIFRTNTPVTDPEFTIKAHEKLQSLGAKL